MHDIRVKCKQYKGIIFGYALALLTVLISGTAVYSVPQFATLRKITLFLLLIVLLCECVTNAYNLAKFKRAYIYIFVFSILFLIISCFKAPQEIVGLVTKIILFLLFLNYCRTENNLSVFLRCLFRIIVVISIISLVFFLLIYVLKINIPFFEFNDGQYRGFLGIFYDAKIYYTSWGAFAFRRLQGIFWEPGVFAVYLIMAIYYYAFYVIKNIVKYLMLFVVCLILTQSTTGLALGVIIIAALLVRKVKKPTEKWGITIPAATIAGGLAMIIINAKRNSPSQSYAIRMSDLTRSLQIWLQHFWLGTGYNNYELFLADGRYGNSNGLMQWCMTMGFIGLIVIMLPFVVNCFQCDKDKRFQQIAETALFLILNSTEPLINTPLMVIWIAIEYYKFAQWVRGEKYVFELSQEQ